MTSTDAMPTALALIDAEVRQAVREQSLDPEARRDDVRRIAESVVAAYERRTLITSLPPLPDADAAVRLVTDSIAGFGPLQQYLDDPEIEEIWINARGDP